VLLLIIYTTFCDTFNQENIDVDASSFFLTVVLSKYGLHWKIHQLYFKGLLFLAIPHFMILRKILYQKDIILLQTLIMCQQLKLNKQ